MSKKGEIKMNGEMNFLTDEILRRAVESCEDEFDSHQLLATLMRDWPNDYAQELDACTNNGDCFVNLHSLIGRKLAGESFHDCVRQTHRKRRSMNCRGQVTDCEIWNRVRA
jgi:hypothetical protein